MSGASGRHEDHGDTWKSGNRPPQHSTLQQDLAAMRRAQQEERGSSSAVTEENVGAKGSAVRTILGRMLVGLDVRSLIPITIRSRHTIKQSDRLVLPYVASEHVAPDIDLPTVAEIVKYSEHTNINPLRPLAILEHMIDSDSGYDPDRDEPDNAQVTAVISGLSEQRNRVDHVISLDLESALLSRQRRITQQIVGPTEPQTEGLSVAVLSVATTANGFREFWDKAQAHNEQFIGTEVILGQVSCFPEVTYTPVAVS